MLLRLIHAIRADKHNKIEAVLTAEQRSKFATVKFQIKEDRQLKIALKSFALANLPRMRIYSTICQSNEEMRIVLAKKQLK